MKNIKIGMVAGVLTLSALTSCKKLDLFPSDSIERTQAFLTMRDAKTWDAGIYSLLRGRVYGSYMYTTDVQADVLNASLDYGNRSGNPHRWGTSFLSDDGIISTVWGDYYKAIANVNVGIDGLDKIPTASAAEVSELNRYKADARVARAFYYSTLILRYAKAYDPATAANDPGVPLLLTFDLNAMPARASIKAVYDQIFADINAAKALYASANTITFANQLPVFSNEAALALEARMRLYAQDWTGAYTAANTLITGGKYPLINTQANLTSYWANDGTQESIMQLALVKSTETANTNSVYLQYITSSSASAPRYDPDWIPTKWMVDLFSASDFRKAAYFDTKNTTIASINTPLVLVNKYPGNPALWTTTVTNYQNAPKIFRIGEMYLIAAEAAQKSGSEPNALIALNALRIARGIGSAGSISGAALTQAIKDERLRELAYEGFRLDDLKRYKEGFTRHDPQNNLVLTQGTQYVNLTIDPSDPKFVWAIPYNDIQINKNITQNPGW